MRNPSPFSADATRQLRIFPGESTLLIVFVWPHYFHDIAEALTNENLKCNAGCNLIYCIEYGDAPPARALTQKESEICFVST